MMPGRCSSMFSSSVFAFSRFDEASLDEYRSDMSAVGVVRLNASQSWVVSLWWCLVLPWHGT